MSRPYALLQFGTVLDDCEDLRSQAVSDRAGHGLAVVFHALYERAGADAVLELPGGREWVAAIEVTELVYQPARPVVAGELARMMEAVG